MVAAAGFDITAVETFYEEVGPRYAGAMTLGSAVKRRQMMSGVREPGTGASLGG